MRVEHAIPIRRMIYGRSSHGKTLKQDRRVRAAHDSTVRKTRDNVQLRRNRTMTGRFVNQASLCRDTATIFRNRTIRRHVHLARD